MEPCSGKCFRPGENTTGAPVSIVSAIWSMYVLLLIGMILSLRNIIRDQEPPVMLMICQLGFIGIVVFLMFWEASGRQMYNQMPGILLGSVLSIEYFWKNLSLKPRK